MVEGKLGERERGREKERERQRARRKPASLQKNTFS